MPARIDLDDRPRRREGLHEVVADGRATLWTRTGAHRLDECGTAVWSCLDGSVTAGTLINDLCAVFDGDADQIRRDVLALLGELADRGLVMVDGAMVGGQRRAPRADPSPGQPGKDPDPDLLAYRLPGAVEMTLEPAARGRPWMDATDRRFANRCLPLLMANQAGWVLHSAHTVVATWDGGPGRENLRVDVLGSEGPPPAASHFGHGILTFALPYLFRTSRGWNLLIRGPANDPKDGIAALEGIVETDWSPATATMNWKLTRPGATVRFDVGEAVCMIVPQRRGQLESHVPVMRDIADVPDVAAGHAAWRESRARFLAAPESDASGRGRPDWQKHYFRGRSPGGPSAEEEHQRDLRLRRFRALDPATSHRD